ncbi:hypothetical protein H112_03977 [Trichophyton rubrum D6]|uniref:Uncharacterized protein n=2 Tax=Trichophyton TaxID=5550 RepID=A0A022W4K7_TRIRU|nr:hypothetical protein H100_03984 [Trichophyton rubrum MR850]EZF42396.1 hypothetical protein H102_03970 [Trichophyton rubrum CBS 100081]EZF53061.1 hypothetical protein H103_03984 [Trichophyton rubrum CBS 288.86]EZF63700.1 hypothetical protein H104_03970 [Trichophyton rubrum CBS 289.86]EZF74305.1 hypothetical protein H105_03999 [Trichophyton soudanense CBS 452.61]EZF84979.1 hypothetical protein H110_03977 [Trichophyton rubrum MR1448]EZF95728.1 hypothetical protein H113_04010 [Trichophyton rub
MAPERPKLFKKRNKARRPVQPYTRPPVMFYSSRLPPRPVTHQPRASNETWVVEAPRRGWADRIINRVGWMYYHYGVAIPVHGMHPLEIIMINSTVIAIVAFIIWVLVIYIPTQTYKVVTATIRSSI